MGLFRSECPACKAAIDWFLKAPEDYICRCGRPVSASEIERSFDFSLLKLPANWRWGDWSGDYRTIIHKSGMTTQFGGVRCKVAPPNKWQGDLNYAIAKAIFGAAKEAGDLL